MTSPYTSSWCIQHVGILRTHNHNQLYTKRPPSIGLANHFDQIKYMNDVATATWHLLMQTSRHTLSFDILTTS